MKNGKALDLTELDTKRGCEAGYIVNILHPVSREPIGFSITVLGFESEAYRTKNLELQRRSAERRGASATVAELDQDDAELLAAVTRAWSPEVVKLDDREYQVADAQALYSRLQWLRGQLFKASNERANFLPGSRAIS